MKSNIQKQPIAQSFPLSQLSKDKDNMIYQALKIIVQRVKTIDLSNGMLVRIYNIQIQIQYSNLSPQMAEVSEQSGSPQKSTKQKKLEKRQKMKAFQSFLQKNQASPSALDILATNNTNAHSDQQERLQQKQTTNCNVCNLELGDRKKLCGFCGEPACLEHLRKKRKNKDTHKFAKICDSCQDKFLFNKYMKLELKNEQSIAAQETIVGAKKNEVEMQQKGRKTKLLLLYHKQNQILARKRENDSKTNQVQNELRQKFQKLTKKQTQLNQLQSQLNDLQKSLPPSFQQDFQALQLQNDKVNVQLLKYERLCNQALKTKSRREKEIYDQYHQWEEREREKMGKGTKGKDDDCSLF